MDLQCALNHDTWQLILNILVENWHVYQYKNKHIVSHDGVGMQMRRDIANLVTGISPCFPAFGSYQALHILFYHRTGRHQLAFYSDDLHLVFGATARTRDIVYITIGLHWIVNFTFSATNQGDLVLTEVNMRPPMEAGGSHDLGSEGERLLDGVVFQKKRLLPGSILGLQSMLFFCRHQHSPEAVVKKFRSICQDSEQRVGV